MPGLENLISLSTWRASSRASSGVWKLIWGRDAGDTPATTVNPLSLLQVVGRDLLTRRCQWILVAIDYCSKADPRGAEAAHYPISGVFEAVIIRVVAGGFDESVSNKCRVR